MSRQFLFPYLFPGLRRLCGQALLIFALLSALGGAGAALAEDAPPQTGQAEDAQFADQRETLERMYETLRRLAPDLVVALNAQDSSLTITLPDESEAQIYPDNLDLALRAEDDPARRQEIFDSHMRNVLTSLRDMAAAGEEAAVDPASVLPVLRARSTVLDDWLEGAPHQGFPGDLVLYWVSDRPETTASLDHIAMERLGLDEAGISSLALSNLAARLADVTPGSDGRFNRLVLDDFYDSSLMLVPDLWRERAAGKEELVAAIPARGILIWIADPTPADLAALRIEVAGLNSHEPWSISPDLFRWTGEGWSVLPP